MPDSLSLPWIQAKGPKEALLSFIHSIFKKKCIKCILCPRQISGVTVLYQDQSTSVGSEDDVSVPGSEIHTDTHTHTHAHVKFT